MVKVAELKKLTQVHVELQGAPNCQNNFEKEQNWRIYIYWFQNLPESYYSNQKCVILAHG